MKVGGNKCNQIKFITCEFVGEKTKVVFTMFSSERGLRKTCSEDAEHLISIGEELSSLFKL